MARCTPSSRARRAAACALLCVVAGCPAGSPVQLDAGRQADRGTGDGAVDETVPTSYPWVTTYAGSTCPGEYRDGPRLQAVLDPHQLALGPKGRLYVAGTGGVRRVDSAKVTTLVKWAAVPSSADGIGVTATGEVLVARYDLVARVSGGKLVTVAGKRGDRRHVDGPAAAARFERINGVWLDAATSDLYILDHTYVRVLRGGSVSTVSGMPGRTPNGWPVDGPVASARFRYPLSAVKVGDVLYVGDKSWLRKIEHGEVTTLSAGTGAPKLVDGPIDMAQFGRIWSLAHWAGIIYMVDRANDRIRSVESGIVSSVTTGSEGLEDGPVASARFGNPLHVVADASGNLYVADGGHNCRIRYIDFGRP